MDSRVVPLPLPGAAHEDDPRVSTMATTVTTTTTDSASVLRRRLVPSVISNVVDSPMLPPSNSYTHRRESLRTASLQQHYARSAVMERELPLSFVRVVFGALSLVLVLSDVLRSGLGVRHLSGGIPAAGISYQQLMPSTFVFSGPGNTSYVAFDRVAAKDTNVRVWLFKYDAMSLVWRALALHNPEIARSFPSCLLDYERSCSPDGADDHEATLDGETVFGMIDALADGLAAHGQQPKWLGEPTSTSLRTRSLFSDRAHHLLLPQLFRDEVWRVHQGLHYSPEALAVQLDRTHRPGALCYGRGARPNVCGELFANYKRACKRGVRKCSGVGLLHMDILATVRGVQALYPGLSVDLTVLESQDDAQEAVGGIASVGFRRGETTSIVRARNCSDQSLPCETVYMLEHRYASARVTSDADEWFAVVAVLRTTGQAYVFVRVLLLVASCFLWVRTGRRRASRQRVLRDTLRLLGKVPVQCVVYGSPVPVVCYALAHLVDAPATYLLLNGSFLSNGGLQNVTLRQFLPLAVMQMRNVWLFATLLQLTVALHASDRFGWRRCQHHQPLHHLSSSEEEQERDSVETDALSDKHRPVGLRGVLGVPEYVISALSCATVAAQYRLPSFRYVPILDVFDLSATSASHRLAAVKYQHASMNPRRGAGSRLLGGVIIDFKFVVSALLLVLGVFVAVNAVVIVLNSVVKWRHQRKTRGTDTDVYDIHGEDALGRRTFRHWRLGSRTPVPYSAGVLWPKVALAVHWTSDFFCLERVPHTTISPSAAARGPSVSKATASFSKQLLRLDRGMSALVVTGFLSASNNSLRRAKHSPFAPASPVMSSRTFDRLQRHMAHVADRDERVGASVAFMNLVIMSDPLVLFYTTRLARIPLGYYAVRGSSVLLLLPRSAAAARDADESARLMLLAKVNASDLSWCELLQCG
jgi:hypothetical protein